MATSRTQLDAIQFAEYMRMRLNEALASAGERHRSTPESWSALRPVAEAVQRAAAILREERER